MSFRLVPKSVTLNDLERRNGRYFASFPRIPVASAAHCVKVHVRYPICWWVLVTYYNGSSLALRERGPPFELPVCSADCLARNTTLHQANELTQDTDKCIEKGNCSSNFVKRAAFCSGSPKNVYRYQTKHKTGIFSKRIPYEKKTVSTVPILRYISAMFSYS